MLVLSRMRDEKIMIGDGNTAHVQLSDDDAERVGRWIFDFQRTEPEFTELLQRILDSRGPIAVLPADIRGDKVRIGVCGTPGDVPIDREEVRKAKRLNPAGKPA